MSCACFVIIAYLIVSSLKVALLLAAIMGDMGEGASFEGLKRRRRFFSPQPDLSLTPATVRRQLNAVICLASGVRRCSFWPGLVVYATTHTGVASCFFNVERICRLVVVVEQYYVQGR